MSGVIPAIPLILIRPFLPESPTWQAEARCRYTQASQPLGDSLLPELRRTTIVTTLMVAMAYGAAFGAIQQIPQIVPGCAGSATGHGRRACPPPQARQITQQSGGDMSRRCRNAGACSAACFWQFLVVRIVSRRKLIRAFSRFRG